MDTLLLYGGLKLEEVDEARIAKEIQCLGGAMKAVGATDIPTFLGNKAVRALYLAWMQPRASAD